jgi:hypothetical protein
MKKPDSLLPASIELLLAELVIHHWNSVRAKTKLNVLIVTKIFMKTLLEKTALDVMIHEHGS